MAVSNLVSNTKARSYEGGPEDFGVSCLLSSQDPATLGYRDCRFVIFLVTPYASAASAYVSRGFYASHGFTMSNFRRANSLVL